MLTAGFRRRARSSRWGRPRTMPEAPGSVRRAGRCFTRPSSQAPQISPARGPRRPEAGERAVAAERHERLEQRRRGRLAGDRDADRHEQVAGLPAAGLARARAAAAPARRPPRSTGVVRGDDARGRRSGRRASWRRPSAWARAPPGRPRGRRRHRKPTTSAMAPRVGRRSRTIGSSAAQLVLGRRARSIWPAAGRRLEERQQARRPGPRRPGGGSTGR